MGFNSCTSRYTRRIAMTCLSLVLFFLLPWPTSHSWGFYGHKRINRMAVFTLPPEMVGFYKQHIEFITNHAVDPDSRRNMVEGEAARHYIDIDHYGPGAFDSVPVFWKQAVAKYTEDTLRAYGIVPWQIEKHYYRLLEAFKAENVDLILHYSADLGHYVADAHVPLHTTENYNGQLTNQKGIHGFWESRIPELKAEEYDYFVGTATYIESPIRMAWRVVIDSHMAVDSVLHFEATLNTMVSPDQKYSYETRGGTMTRVYSAMYTERFDAMIKGQVERRMREAIRMVGSVWYTAWVDAGRPDLDKLGQVQVSDSLTTVLQATVNTQSAKGHDDSCEKK